MSTYCHDIAKCTAQNGRARIDWILFNTYSKRVKVTLAEPSSSIVVRSEHQFHRQQHQRHSIRKHYYEVLRWDKGHQSDGTPPRKCDSGLKLDCSIPLRPGDVLGHYLGFVDFRLVFKQTPLAMGILAPPRRLQIDPDAYCITGLYGQLFGGPSFPGTVYSMHDDENSGAMCAQACCIMALGFLADRGAIVRGSYDLTFLGRPREALEGRPDDCLANRTPKPEEGLVITGLRPHDTERALNQCRTSARCVEIKLGLRRTEEAVAHELRTRQRVLYDRLARVAEQYAWNLIQAYVSARYPVILSVRTDKWQPKNTRKTGHAVTVVGYKSRSLHQHRERCLIIHDPAEAPFRERPVHECLNAAWAYGMLNPNLAKPPDNSVNKVRFLITCVAERRIKRHLHDCFLDFQRRHPNVWPVLCGLRPHPQRPKARFDYRFVLLHRDDLHTLLSPIPLDGSLGPLRRDMNERLVESGVPPHFFWCIAGYQDGRLTGVWLFDAELERDGLPPRARIIITSTSRLLFETNRSTENEQFIAGFELQLPYPVKQ